MSEKKCLVVKKIEIDMGHRVPWHKSKCKNLHGHRYVIEAGVRGSISLKAGTSDEGMVIDFGDIKEILVEEVDQKLDHGFMMYEKDPFAESFKDLKDQKIIFVPFIPTAENIAKYLFETMTSRFTERSLELAFIKVWETPTCSALYPADY